MATRKQYLACVQLKHQMESGEYYNLKALMGTSLQARYYKSLEAALEDLQKCIALKNRGERTETTWVNGIGIDLVIDAETAKANAVVDWYIKEREVTDWEEVARMKK